METALGVGYNLLDRVSCFCSVQFLSDVAQGLVPDCALRVAIRALCRQRLREIDHGTLAANHEAKMKWIEEVRRRESIAEQTEKANEQHYEVGSLLMST